MDLNTFAAAFRLDVGRICPWHTRCIVRARSLAALYAAFCDSDPDDHLRALQVYAQLDDFPATAACTAARRRLGIRSTAVARRRWVIDCCEKYRADVAASIRLVGTRHAAPSCADPLVERRRGGGYILRMLSEYSTELAPADKWARRMSAADILDAVSAGASIANACATLDARARFGVAFFIYSAVLANVRRHRPTVDNALACLRALKWVEREHRHFVLRCRSDRPLSNAQLERDTAAFRRYFAGFFAAPRNL